MKNVIGIIISLAATLSFAANPVLAQASQDADQDAASSTAVGSDAATSANADAASTAESTNGAKVSIPTKTTGQKRPRIGLALGGGGSRGAAHVGVLKVLKEEGIPIDLIAGTSIGSVVGGFYAAGVPLDDIGLVFEKKIFTKEFTPMPILTLMLEPTLVTARLFGYKPYDGLFNGVKFKKYADKVAGCKKIEELKIPFAAVVTDVVTGQSCRLTEGDLGLAMQASTAVPELKRPVQIGDKLYCDGGLINNVPVSHIREMGADFVIAIDIDEHLKDMPLKKFRGLGSMARQALKIQLATFDLPNRKNSDIFINPDTTGINIVSFKKSDGKRGIDAGIAAAREAMPEIKRKLAEIGITPEANKVQ
jgi:Predicted esterase of the alpha-beta hydrolase superfamily